MREMRLWLVASRKETQEMPVLSNAGMEKEVNALEGQGIASRKFCYVVERGSYSDYRVLGVFTAKKLAEDFKAEVNTSDCYEEATVARWPLNPGVLEINAGLRLFNLTLNYDGRTERLEQVVRGDCSWDTTLHVWERTKADHWRGQPIGDAITGTIWARNEKHAVKICNDFRAQQIAANKMHNRTGMR